MYKARFLKQLKKFRKLLLLLILVAIGIVLQLSGVFDVEVLLVFAREYADEWWLIVILLILQFVLFTFALAGSLVFWVAVSIYPPVTTTLIVAVGACVGGVGAYYFSSYLSEEWVKKVHNSHAYRFLHKEDNFFTLFALRVFPGFPHSLVNYSSGVLRVRLSHFIAAAFLGVGLKSYIYADIIYNLTSTVSVTSLLNVSTLAPLVLLSLFTFAGVFIKYKLTHKNKGA